MEILNIPNCNFSNIDYMIVDEILTGLSNILKKYPLLKYKIDAIGTNKFVIQEMIKTDRIINHINTARYNKTNDESCFKTVYTWLGDFKNPNYYIKSKLLFIGLGVNSKYDYNELIKKIVLLNKMGCTYAYNIKTAIYHEIGHVFDLIFLFSNDDTFAKNIKKFMNEKRTDYSCYSYLNEREFIAECFCKYMEEPNYNNAVSYIGNTIDKYYKKFSIEQKFKENAYREKVLKIRV